ncbi:LCP family protein [Streptomyces sp. NBC_00370]|uniref:LCP family protein n=1 Tax=Streptomyces sp. NBC_00370 TaxID=2975728 RepID=UPI002E25CEC9
MDAQNRGQADDMDPADQWVLNPQTGNYELRLDNSAGQSSTPGPAKPRDSSRRADPDRPASRQDARPGSRSESRSESRSASRSGRSDVPGPRASRRKGQAAEATAQGRRKRKQKKSGKKKALLWTGGTLAFLLVAGSVGGYAYYQHLNNNITSYDVGTSDKPVTADKPINILIIGTDKRTGKGNEGYGDKGSVGHADTNFLLHVSKDRTNATALSIPRDLITDIPDCETKQPDGSTKIIPGTEQQRFNTSLGQDGRDPGCTMKTVQEITGLKVDHFMMADFNAVKSLTTAVGGVDICLAHPVDDPDSHLKLPAGEANVQGEQALAFVRTRHSFGNQGDLDRIKVQQQFMASLARKIQSKGTLTSPSKMFKLAEAATKALAVDSGIGSITKLTSLATQLKGIDPKNISFITLPVLDNPNEIVHATVVINKTQADPLFSMLQSDTSLTEVKKEAAAKKSQQAKALKGPKAPAADVRVDVYNGGGPQGSAQETLSWLQNDKGAPKTTNKGNAPANVAKTTLEYAPNQADMARTVASWMGLPATSLKQGTEDAVGLEAMTLTLGKDFKGAGVPITGPAKVPDGVQKVEADKQVCAK